MFLKEVLTPWDERIFLRVHIDCNQGNKEWIRPLDHDIQEVFNKTKNKVFKYGEAVRWILVNDNNQAFGRIAAFVNKKYKNKGDEFKVGGIGFFDCINDQGLANQLFDRAKSWLSEKGMEAMDGPINFGERNKWWGLLIDGFHSPLYGMNYNPPYYQILFEEYGFKNFYNQICWSLPVAAAETQLCSKFYIAHEKFSNNKDFKASRIQKNEGKKFAHDFCIVYNKAWAKHEGLKEMNERQMLAIFRSIKSILDPDLLWFVYYKGNPIALWINIPDINQVIRKLDGKFNLWSKLLFFIYMKLGAINRFVGTTFGIVPEFQGSGVDYYMIVEAEKVIKAKRKYKEVELQWQGDFNPKMLNISKNLGAVENRRLVTYRYIFDQSQTYKRHPIIL
jgi:hypothetical protein